MLFSSPPPLFFTFLEDERRLLIYLLFVFARIERVLSLEMILRGKYKGDLQYLELPLVEILPPLVRINWALSLVTPSAFIGEGSTSQADPGFVDAPVGGVSRNNPPP